MAGVKAPNHAWRKKPRKFAPKSRLGCKTCKVRRIKCDLIRPSCRKCQTTGRTCDGYGDVPGLDQPMCLPTCQKPVKAFNPHACDLPYSSDTPATWPGRANSDSVSLSLHNIGPFMVLPATSSALPEVLSFFQWISVKHLSQYRLTDTWSEILLFFCQTVPAVRHASIALALVQRNHHDERSAPLPHPVPLYHYNRAIQLLLARKAVDDLETKTVTLLLCYLFTCFDNITRNYTQALAHLRGGVKLSLCIGEADDGQCQSNTEHFTTEIVRQIRRLDMQVPAMVVDWEPLNIHNVYDFQLSPPNDAFTSLEHASNHLQPLIARVLRLHWTSHPTSLMDQTSPRPWSPKDVVLKQLDGWFRLFENMLRARDPLESNPESQRHATLLQLQHTIVWILLNSIGPEKEMEFDKYLPQFKRCMVMADELTSYHTSGSTEPIFTPEVGIIPVLYIIGVKCRQPTIRRQAVSILRRRRIREAAWDSTATAIVVERAAEIEERGLSKEQKMQGMGQIPVRQRIESLSWRQLVIEQVVTNLGFVYTLCFQDKEHLESGLM